MISLKALDQALVNGYSYNHSAHLLTFPPGSINVMILKKPGEPDINLKYISPDARAISSVFSKHENGSPVKKFS
jgi:hypothetical protein